MPTSPELTTAALPDVASADCPTAALQADTLADKPADDAIAAVPQLAVAAKLARNLGLLVALVGCLGAGWSGGIVGALGACACAMLLARLLGSGTRSGLAERSVSEVAIPHGASRVGAEVMVSQVIPVWSKQVEVTREAANDGLAKLLDSFGQMGTALDSLLQNLSHFQPNVAPGELGSAVQAHSREHNGALTTLMAASQRAFDQRDAAAAELSRCADALDELRQVGKTAREVSKHTRLVAFNAAIEANRLGRENAGAQAVANETRMLAGRMAEIGEQIERLIARLMASLTFARRELDVADTTPDELRLEIELHARQALTAMLGSLGASLQGSGAVQESSALLRRQVDDAFVEFQFGDRLSQMLSIVANDMRNFADWVAAHPRATQSDAAEWLLALESSYTMEEQRSQHHGNVHIDRGSEVEFF